MKKIIVTTAVIVFSMAIITYASPDSNSIINDGIEYYIQTDKSVYNLGEDVQMLFRVTNLGDEDVIIGCSRSPEFNLWVQKDGEAIWALAHWFKWYSPGVELLAGESIEIPHTWDMNDDYGKPVKPATYNVVGVMYNYGPTQVPVPITILPPPATTYYVDAVDGDDNNDGLTPETAFATIQMGIDMAYDGDTVLVAPGTYTGDGNRNINFLGKAITVCSTDPNNQYVVAATVIDCQGIDRGFKFLRGENRDSIVAGLTITNGLGEKKIYAYGDGGQFPTRGGAGIFCYNSSPTIKNCIITRNIGGFQGRGGAIYVWGGAPLITNCNISKNSTEWGGGGIWCRNSNIVIKNCTVNENMETDDWFGGGGIQCWNGQPVISHCEISSNTSMGQHQNGGGVYCRSPDASFEYCTITKNAALDGGGIYFYRSSPPLFNCKITSNNAIRNGGGIYCLYSSPYLVNCTFSHNSAGSSGGCTYCWGSSPTINSCILWDDIANRGSEIALSTYKSSCPSNLTVSYSNVQGGQGAASIGSWCSLIWGEGNIEADPCFVELGYWDANDTPDDVNDDFWVEGDYYLLPDSLCIDAGDPCFADPNETDIDGNPRVINGRIDMGAYETNYIPAAMKLTPQMLNCNSKGKYIKAHITLPEGFLPEDVDVNESAIAEPIGIESEYIKVLGSHKGQVRLEICFDREAFCYLLTDDDSLEVTVIGSLTTSRYFYATDTIKIKPRH